MTIIRLQKNQKFWRLTSAKVASASEITICLSRAYFDYNWINFFDDLGALFLKIIHDYNYVSRLAASG